MSADSKKDLRHFLILAQAQLRNRLRALEASEAYSTRINRMRALEELIKEQVPAHAETKNSRPPTGTVG